MVFEAMIYHHKLLDLWVRFYRKMNLESLENGGFYFWIVRSLIFTLIGGTKYII